MILLTFGRLGLGIIPLP